MDYLLSAQVRNPHQNIADLSAQIAANQKGVKELQKLVDQYSLKTVSEYMQHVLSCAEEAMRKLIDGLKEASHISWMMIA